MIEKPVVSRKYISQAESPFLLRQDAFSRKWGKAGIVSTEGLEDQDTYDTVLKSPENLVKATEDENLTDFGRAMWDVVEGHRFIDLGCGDPDRSYFPRILAQLFEAESYEGVDLNLEENEERVDEFGIGEYVGDPDFVARFVPGNFLEYVQGLDAIGGYTFFVSGIEPETLLVEGFVPSSDFDRERLEKSDNARQTIATLVQAMSEKMSPGDAVIIGIGSRGFTMPKDEFEAVATAESLNRYNDPIVIGTIYIKK